VNRRGRKVSLVATFGVVSLLLAAGLCLILALRIDRTISQRSLRDLKKSTSSAIGLTSSIILSSVAPASSSGAVAQGARDQSRVISAAATELVRNGDCVAVEAVMSNGTVIGSASADAIGTTIANDDALRAAFAGVTQLKTLHQSDSAALTPVERRLLRTSGDLLRLERPFRLSPTTPVIVVIRAWATLGPSERQAASDIRVTVGMLAAGLLAFWAVLFRLVLGASRALTRQSKANAYLATHDSLTGLPNRALLRDRVEQAIRASQRSGSRVALIVLDLDRFKEINDTLGHPYGDSLLKCIGPRLRERLREADTVARLGGDEFAVLLPDLPAPGHALEVADKLTTALQQHFTIDGTVVDVGCSMGVAITPEHGDGFDQLMQHADIAMYVAKRDSLGVTVYAPELAENSAGRLSLLGDLRRALDSPDQLVLHYQPKANLPSGEVRDVEALVRWQHPQLGLLPPSEFIPLAESTGMIRPLTWCILRKALEQNRLWADEGLFLRVAVNLSARCLLDVGLPEGVVNLLAETGVPAERLELELTESAVMSDPEKALAVLRELEADGIRLAIDDFGTGYSSMTYLKRLPVHEIKIDKSFVTNMASDASDAAIVRSSLLLASNLALDVVAEGVETWEVWEQLGELGCPSVQGFFLSKPLPAAELAYWMSRHGSSPFSRQGA
jgi:diguanylate cyclase (GGDEF)-like protein